MSVESSGSETQSISPLTDKGFYSPSVKSKKVVGLVYMGLATVAAVLVINHLYGHPPAEEGVMAVMGIWGVTYLLGFSGK